LNTLKNHLFPLILSIIVVYLTGEYLLNINFESNTTVINGRQDSVLRFQANYANGVQAEVDFVAALKNKNSICMMGSSEFGNPQLNYYPFLFLRDSLNMNIIGFGHAYHQCFSIYTQLLAFEDELENANICIILSPSWFITEGTNIEGFIEFVPDNYLQRIIHNPEITLDEKLIIGKYLFEHFDQINQPTLSISYLSNLYRFRNTPYLQKWLNLYKNRISNISYNIKLLPKKTPHFTNKSLIRKSLKQKYLSDIKTNKIFVNDAYYTEHLSNKKRSYEHGVIERKDFKNKRELYDFKLLVDLLKRKKCKASFVLQSLNNYHYKGLELFKATESEILYRLKKHNFPTLDMFSLTKRGFEPGVLNDIMHTGDYGWSLINQFVYTNYYPILTK
jgi:poly-D-alanine transfer protein DltD